MNKEYPSGTAGDESGKQLSELFRLSTEDKAYNLPASRFGIWFSPLGGCSGPEKRVELAGEKGVPDRVAYLT